MPQFKGDYRPTRPGHAQGRPGDDILAHPDIQLGDAGDEAGPAFAMINDDDLAEPAIRPGKGNAANPRRHHLRGGADGNCHPARTRLASEAFAETSHKPTLYGQEKAQSGTRGQHCGSRAGRSIGGIFGTGGAHDRAGQARQLVAQQPGPAKIIRERAEVARLFRQGKRAFRFAIGHPGALPSGQPLLDQDQVSERGLYHRTGI